MIKKGIALLVLLALAFTFTHTLTAQSQVSTPADTQNTQNGAPHVISTNPAPHQEITPDQPIQLTFDQPMDRASVQNALSIAPSLNAQFSWRDDQTLTLTFAVQPQRGQTYTLTLGADAKSAAGTPLGDAFRLPFDVAANLKITQVIPSDNTTQVQATSTITVVFNRPVVPLVNTADQQGLIQPLSFSPAVTGHGEWVNTSIFVFHPDKPLPGGTRFTVSTATDIKDITGSPLDKAYTWQFTTVSPQVLSVEPQADATNAGLDQPIRITFNQPMDTASTEKALSVVNAATNAPLAGKITWEDNNQTLVFTPTARAATSTTSRVSLTGAAHSASGIASVSNPFSQKFTTVPYPKVIASQPTNGQQNVPPGSGLSVQYNTSMDEQSFVDHVHVSPEAKDFAISGGGDSLYVGFTSLPLTTYTVTIDAGVKDIYGNVVKDATVITFTTGSLPPQLGVATLGTISLTNAYKTDTVLLAASVNIKQIDVTLYATTLAQQTFNQPPNTAPPGAEQIRAIHLPVEDTPNKMVVSSLKLAGDQGGALKPGLYWIQGSSPQLLLSQFPQPFAFEHLLAVGTANLTLKTSPNEALVWVTDLKTGQPVPNALITLYNETYGQTPAVIATGKTDAAGLYRTATAQTSALQNGSVVWAVAQGDGLYGIAASQSGMVMPYADAANNGIYPTAYLPKYAAYLYTDQPIYRPGHPVYFRGVLRNQDDVHFSVPDGGSVHVRLNDPQGKPLYEKDVPLTAFGTFSDHYDLPQDAPIGDFGIVVTYQNQPFNHDFQVAEYRPPEFQVAATAKADQVVNGDQISVDINSTFFFGGAVSGAKVTWNALANQSGFNYMGDGQWDFAPISDQYMSGRSVGSGSGVTDANGHFTITLPADLGGVNTTQAFTIEATLTDISNQAISGRTTVTVHPAKVYVGLHPDTLISEAGKPSTVKLITVGWDSLPIANQKVRVDVSTLSWTQDPKTLEWKQTKTPVIGDSVTTDAKGLASYTFTPTSAGLYVVEATTRDLSEKLAGSGTYLWVSGPQPFNYQRGDQKTLTLVADKKQYLPGDTATILIPSPFSGAVKALVTVERAGILKTDVIDVTGSFAYSLPITTEDAPNVYVAVTLVKGMDDPKATPDYRSGMVQIHARVAQKLIVTLKPSVSQAMPGDTVHFDIQTTDLDGKPIAASVGLSLTDLANLSVSAETASSIFDAFWSDRPLAVFTSISLTDLIDAITPQPAVFAEAKSLQAGVIAPATAASGAPAPSAAQDSAVSSNSARQAAPPVAVRSNFVDTPLWSPDTLTDATGHGAIDVKLPDNLTTWRLDGRGISKETYAGQSTTDLISTKPLLIRPTTPRFFVVGDQAELAAVVNNNTGSDLSVNVTLDAKGATLDKASAQTVTIPKAGRVRVTWTATVQDVAGVDLTFSAVSGTYSDASKPAVGIGDARLLPVYKYSAPDTVATAGTLTAAGTRTEGITLPPATAAPTSGTLTIKLNPSLAATTLDGLTYLENYPYQCTEQTVSKFLPNIITYQALQKLGQGTPALKANLQIVISQALAQLKTEQHTDGGWGWYPEEVSYPVVTAYAVLGLVEAKSADLLVDPSMLDRAVRFLLSTPKTINRDTTLYDLDSQAFINYVLARAGSPNVSALDSLFVQREKMNYFARAFLAQAYFTAPNADQTKINTLLSDLSNAAILSATGAHWEEPQRDWYNWDSDTRTTAIVLKTLVDLTPKSDLIPNVVRWLMVARRGDAWESTQETAWAVMGLTDWMAVSGELNANYTFNVGVNGASVGTGTASAANLRDTQTLSVDVSKLLSNRVTPLTIQRSDGTGALYYTATLTVNQPVEAIVPVSRGLQFTRTYLLNGKAVTSAQVGDVLTVALDITVPHDLYYAVINDPIPAGVETVDTSLKTTSQIGQTPELTKLNPVEGWGWWWFSNTQIQTDKVVMSARYLPAGSYRYVYQVRASQPGTYRVIPPNGQEFYFPEVFGRGAGSLFTVTGSAAF